MSDFVYTYPVAVCTLADTTLPTALPPLLHEAGQSGVIVAPLQTENLGIEQIIAFTVTQPALRFLVVAGQDARQCVGHLPGQTLVALAQNGVDANKRIIGAEGKRPVLKNISVEMIEHFRQQVTVLDLVDCSDVGEVMNAVEKAIAQNPGPMAQAFSSAPDDAVTITPGYRPDHLKLDPAGYLVVELERRDTLLRLKHFTKKGDLQAIIEGNTEADLYYPAIELGLITQMDHAAYLGKELAKAAFALAHHLPYVQDEPLQLSLPVLAQQSASSAHADR